MKNTKKMNPTKQKPSNNGFCINKHNHRIYAYKDHCYEVYRPKSKGLINKVVKAIIADYEIMLSHYSRVLVARIDLHPKSFSPTNEAITQFLEQQVKKMREQYGCKVMYHCAREQETSNREHYHVELMLSGHKIRHAHKLLSLLGIAWNQYSGGHTAQVPRPFCLVYRGNKSSLRPAIYRSSYLAKEHSKERNGKTKGFISNKYPPAVHFEPGNDLMLVAPDITYMKHKKKIDFMNLNESAKAAITSKRHVNPHCWFETLAHELQFKECLASRTNELLAKPNNASLYLSRDHSLAAHEPRIQITHRELNDHSSE
ncbi:inovirus Gp2 family protein [Shewanella sp. C32]|uniref:Inovirus Gp2 family protein n=1 Tax=Shewanella electrica TaxID=515560 RepID=A0ABT2FRM2_9GAMM|nr:inovirus-type Gp2 protein [Shewanella electrica]MCH1926393.1 inovirus Gp2 family protein [Shewanella electrica]MCS4557836.1 inovirus Gp2 family protein [Shewanella electrica]